MNDQQRIDELESRVAFQDDTIAALNDALAMQQQRIGHLEKTLSLLLERTRQAEPDIQWAADDPPPPHY